MRRVIILGVVIVVGALSIGLRSSQSLEQAALDAAQIEQVKDNLYVITGSSPTNREAFSGGNTGVFVTDQGVTVVDTKLAGWGQVILDRIRTVTDEAVVRGINTHTHGDHNGSNDFFPETVDIVAHENTKANMIRMDAFQGENVKFLPKQTYSDRLTLGSGDDRVELYYFGRGHTDGDTFIVYPALRVLQTGDMFPWRDAAFLDSNNGGSGDTGVIVETRPKTKKPSMYKVLMLNDDYTPMEFVVLVLQQVFRKGREEAVQIMLNVHTRGSGVCGVFPAEIAETKVRQVLSFARDNKHPLQCTMEPE